MINMTPSATTQYPMSFESDEPIAIVGLSCRLPGADDGLDTFWRNLMQGKDSVTEIPMSRWDIKALKDLDIEASEFQAASYGAFLKNIEWFDSSFFNINPREAETIDPQQRILLELFWHAFEHAGINPLTLKNTLTGVFVGSTHHDYNDMLVRYGRHDQLDIYHASGSSNSMLAGRMSYLFGFQGPSMLIDTSCSSSLVSVIQACTALNRGECETAIAGGVNIMLAPWINHILAKAKMLSPNGRCKSFSKDGEGYVRGEGAAAVVLKRLSSAKASGDTIHAVICGSAIIQDGPSSGLTVPNGQAQELCINTALKKAKIQPKDVSYIETHGTGTPKGDPIEFLAIQNAYQQHRNTDSPLVVGALKTNIGHLEAVAGVAGLIKVVLALKHQQIPGNLFNEVLHPNINPDLIPALFPTQSINWQPKTSERIAAVSSFGFSGTNAHMIVKEYKPDLKKQSISDHASEHLFCCSARSANALSKVIKNYISFLEKPHEFNLHDLCLSANIGRAHFEFRAAFLCRSKEDLLMQLSQWPVTLDETWSNQFTKTLQTIKNQYASNETIDWADFYKNTAYQKIELPNYPFQRQYYWARQLDNLLVTHQRDDLPYWYYEEQWLPIAESRQETSRYRQVESWLILADESGLAEQIATNLRQEGKHCLLVYPKQLINVETDKVGINPVLPADYDLLIREFSVNANKLGVINLWPCTATTDLNLVQLQKAQELDCASTLHLYQACIKHNIIPFWVTVFYNSIPVNQANIAIEHTPVIGLLKTLQQEQPAFGFYGVDLDNAQAVTHQAKQLELEMNLAGDHKFVALRQDKSYAAKIVACPITSRKPMSFSDEKNYLITGGLGALGLELAQHLANKGARHLLLTARHKPNDQQQAILDQLAQEGVEVNVLQYDVSKIEDIQRLDAVIANLKTPLGGAFHVAGVLADGLATNLTWQDFENVFASKVYGGFLLSQMLKSYSLDFLCLFSSTAAFLGSVGQSNYAAANQFLNGLATIKNTRSYPITSINWGPWDEKGMWHQTRNATKRLSKFVTPLSIKQNLYALDLAMEASASVIAVTQINWQALRNHVNNPSFDVLISALIQGESHQQETVITETEEVPTADMNQVYNLDMIDAHLIQIIARITQASVDDVRQASSLTYFGFDSIILMELAQEIEQAFKVSLPISHMNEDMDIRELSDIIHQHLQSINKKTDVICFNQGNNQHAPLIFIHGASSGAESYLAFAEHLAPEQPFYVVDCGYLYDENPSLESIEQLATLYLDKISNVIAPHHQFYLGGWSMGGVIAYEMAQQLAQQNRTVKKVFLLDSWLLSALDSDKQKDHCLNLEAVYGKKSKRHLDYFASLPVQQRDRLEMIWQLEKNMLLNYFGSPYAGEVCLFKAQTGLFGQSKSEWNGLAENLQIVPVKGDHYRLLQKDMVQSITTFINNDI